MGRSSREVTLPAEKAELPEVWNSNRAHRVCRSEGTGDSSFKTADRLGLSIDAGQPRGGAARSQLGKSSPSRIRIPEGVGVTTDQNAVHGTWVRTKSNEERDNITGPCFPTWSMAK